MVLAVEKMGARHEACAVSSVVVDRERRVVTTPAYMLAQSISEAAAGIEMLVREVFSMALSPVAAIQALP